MSKLTGSLIANPRMDRWISFLDDKTARVASGKVEIGQGRRHGATPDRGGGTEPAARPGDPGFR